MHMFERSLQYLTYPQARAKTSRMHWVPLILIIATSGAIGGASKCLFSLEESADSTRPKAILKDTIRGILAALLVPLFLAFSQSKIIDNLESKPTAEAMLVLVAYSICAALLAQQFIDKVTSQFSQALDQQRKETEKLKEAAVYANKKVAAENIDLDKFVGTERKIMEELKSMHTAGEPYLPYKSLYKNNIDANQVKEAVRALEAKGALGTLHLEYSKETYLYLKP